MKAISGGHTVQVKNELERNVTIKLGYANAKIYKLDDSGCPPPNVTDPAEVAHLISFLQTAQGRKGTASWPGMFPCPLPWLGYFDGYCAEPGSR